MMEQTLSICEECLQITGFQGKGDWIPHITCDVCGDVEYCSVFGPTDTLIVGDAYDNDPAWGQAIQALEALPHTHNAVLACSNCGYQPDQKEIRNHLGDPCEECETGAYIIREKPIESRSGMLVCSVCGTNWGESWGIWCEKCRQGFKHVQYIPEQIPSAGKTEKVCFTCDKLWKEPDGCTTCSHCGGDGWAYQVPKYPDIPTRAMNMGLHLPYSARKPKVWVPDYYGPVSKTGGINMVPKEVIDARERSLTKIDDDSIDYSLKDF